MQVYVGADQLSIETLDAGMDGVIGGGGSSVMAKIFVDIWHLFKKGDKEQAQKLQDRMNQWCVMALLLMLSWQDLWRRPGWTFG